MRKLAITLAVSTMLVLAVAASAALPVTGPFAGKTSLRPINGFSDLVTFSVSGKSLKKFTFGTLGCFAISGAFPVGTDPYGDPTATAVVKGSIPVTPMGTFTITAKPVLADPQGTVTTAVIQGSFTELEVGRRDDHDHADVERRHLRPGEDEVHRGSGDAVEPRYERLSV